MLLRRTMLSLAAAGFLFTAPLSAVAGEKKEVWAPAVKPKDLTTHVNKGLAWLTAHQLPTGGWGQGEESTNMGGAMATLKDKGNVADTCMATLAILRAGSTASKGEYAKNVKKGLEFVLGEIES